MLSEKNFKDIATTVLILGLFVLAILIIKPVVMSIILGILLAYLFYPIYIRVYGNIKNKTVSALLVCLILLMIVIVPLVLILSSLLNQAINFYTSVQGLDISVLFENIIPSFISDSEVSRSLSGSFNTLVSNVIASSVKGFSNFIINLPSNLLKLFIVIFIFFLSLRDGEKGIKYLKSLSPLRRETENKLFKQFKDVTYSVLVGQVVIGVLQGIIAGIGYFIFGVPNALILALLTALVGIIPLIGPWLVWVPIDIYLFATGHTGAGFGLLVYGLIVISWLDAIIRPLIVARKARINSAIAIIGMIGGLFVFGILGLILGPLILAYVILIIDMYRESKGKESIVLKDEE